MDRLTGLLAIALASVVACGSATAAPTPSLACHAGPYRLSDDREIVISPSGEEALRYRFLDGRSGRLFPTGAGAFEGGPGWSAREPVETRASFGDCAAGLITFRQGGASLQGRRIVLPITPVRFTNGDVELYGELHLPEDGKPRALIALQYGSGQDSAVANNFVQHLLPLKGVGVLVFDKRGTGRSTGAYSAHLQTLAADMAVAVETLRAMPQARGVPLGVMGESQGGWVAPLAATKAPVDFVVASYGLAVSMEEEDRQEVVADLQAKGYGPDVIRQAEQVQKVVLQVMNSRFTEGLDELQRLKTAYGDEAWFKGLSGDLTSRLTAAPEAGMAEVKTLFSFPYDLTYDPLPTLKAIAETPSLWILAGRDTEAPSAGTLAILRGLQEEGAALDVAVFPNAEHGMIEVADPKTGDLAGGHSPGYFDLLADWMVRRKMDRPYGAAIEYPRR